jgi:hypothetical protein
MSGMPLRVAAAAKKTAKSQAVNGRGAEGDLQFLQPPMLGMSDLLV